MKPQFSFFTALSLGGSGGGGGGGYSSCIVKKFCCLPVLRLSLDMGRGHLSYLFFKYVNNVKITCSLRKEVIYGTPYNLNNE